MYISKYYFYFVVVVHTILQPLPLHCCYQFISDASQGSGGCTLFPPAFFFPWLSPWSVTEVWSFAYWLMEMNEQAPPRHSRPQPAPRTGLSQVLFLEGFSPTESRLAPVASECREPQAEGAYHQPRGWLPGPPGVSERVNGKFPPQAHQPQSTSMGQPPWQLHPVLWALLVAVTAWVHAQRRGASCF